MSVRKLIVQYVGDVLLLPKLERDVRHIYERDRIGRTVREYVPIVRCRDCRHYREHKFFKSTLGMGLGTDINDVCMFFSGGVKVEPDGFCAWAERREQ